MDAKPIRFIARRVEVEFDEPPDFETKPPCPDRFFWNGETFDVVTVLTEWDDVTGRSMQSHHAALAQQGGTWGTGRVYFRVKTDSGRVFDLYYNPAPRDADDSQDSWILFREMKLIAAENGGGDTPGDAQG